MSDYTADDITALKGLEGVILRPAMYIGSTDDRGLIHLCWEIFDNSVDEALAGHCTRIDVTLHEDGSVEVSDNGRGIPVDTNKKTGKSGLELCLTELHAGGKFGGKAFAVSGGLHGVGASVTNALSTRLDATVKRDGKYHHMSFKQGVPGIFAGEGGLAEFTKKAGLRSEGKTDKNDTGTTIRFWPDKSIFLPDAVIDPILVKDRLQRTAFLVPGLTCVLHARGESFEYCYSGGISDMATFISQGAPLTKTPIYLTGSGEFVENVPSFDDEGAMTMREVTRTVGVEIALVPTTGYDSDIKGFVNVVSTQRGTHVKGFEAGLLKWVRDNATLKAKDEPPKIEDCTEGMYAVISIKLPEPEFEGQTKEILGTKAVQGIVRDVVVEGMNTWVKGRGNGQASKQILEKAVTAARIRTQAREQRDTQRRKTALEGGNNLPAKLVDCRERANSELILVEGDSAMGSARAGRYASHQAILPLRGKILNARKATLKQIFDNAECAGIIQTLGAGSGKDFDINAMRYERVVTLADADQDGLHITTLLITLFWQMMRPIIEEGRLYVAMPPLHRVTTKGRNPQQFYTFTQEEMEAKVRELEKAGETVVRPVQRYKGLGEVNFQELRETTLDPSTRRIRRVNVADAAAAEAMVELLMGSEVEPRRNYIVANKKEVDV